MQLKRKQVEFIFDFIDDLLLDERYEEVDEMLDMTDPAHSSLTVCLSILTITFSEAINLRKRGCFYERCIEVFGNIKEFGGLRSKVVDTCSYPSLYGFGFALTC